MAEYIDREALMKFPIRANRCDKEHANTHFINGIESVMEYAELLPTVDAVPVVRCRDCKFAYINSFSAASGIALCTSSGQPMQQDDFCSYGERKEGAEC